MAPTNTFGHSWLARTHEHLFPAASQYGNCHLRRGISQWSSIFIDHLPLCFVIVVIVILAFFYTNKEKDISCELCKAAFFQRGASPCGVMDNVTYVQGLAQPLVIHHPYVSTSSLSKGWGFRGTHRPTCLAANTLSLRVLRGRRGSWAPRIYKVYLVYRELCHLVHYTCPIILPLIGGL